MAAPLSVPVSLNLNLSNINTNCCNGTDCFRNCCQTTVNLQNAKIIASGPNEVSIEPPPGCGSSCSEALYAIFCCCCAKALQNKYAAGKALYERSLTERLGEAGKQVVLQSANLQDLPNRTVVTAEDADKLERVVSNLHSMVRTLRMSAASHHAEHTDIPIGPVDPKVPFNVQIEREGKLEPFNEQELRGDIAKLPVLKPLEPAQIDQIVQSVKGAILHKQHDEVQSAFIRIVIMQELKKLGNGIKQDAIHGQPPQDLLAALQDKGLQALGEREFHSLLALSTPSVLQAPQGPSASAPQGPSAFMPQLLLGPQGPAASASAVVGQTALV